MRAASRTYYDVLGVSPETPIVVLKAAYRALAKEYHPDSGADAASDPERFIELQDAYAVLSDPESRSYYDGQLREAMDAERLGAVPSRTGEVVGSPAWAEVIHASPALQAVHARFILYSGTLAASFREAAITGRGEDDLLAFAEAMEDHFLSEYFGDDVDVRGLAKILLLRCRRGAVVELNEMLAANPSLGPEDKRRLLAEFVERHFAHEGLLSPWLRERFGGAAPPVPEPVQRPEIAAAKPPRRPHAMRAMLRVFCWSFAMYFGLVFVASLAD